MPFIPSHQKYLIALVLNRFSSGLRDSDLVTWLAEQFEFRSVDVSLLVRTSGRFAGWPEYKKISSVIILFKIWKLLKP